jgi:hypothetical protein
VKGSAGLVQWVKKQAGMQLEKEWEVEIEDHFSET